MKVLTLVTIVKVRGRKPRSVLPPARNQAADVDLYIVRNHTIILVGRQTVDLSPALFSLSHSLST
jgi:hypothetical protein